MTSSQEAFFKFMDQYASFVETLAQQEIKKYSALISYDAHKVDRAISDQQAALMQLEKMEKQRLDMQQQAGFADWTFRKIIESLEKEERQNAHSLFLRVENAITELRFMNAKSIAFTKENLRAISGIDTPEGKGIKQGYAPGKGAVETAKSSLFETKI